MGEELESILQKVIDLVLFGIVILSLFAAIYLVYDEDYHVLSKNARDISLLRDTAISSDNNISNLTLVIPESLHLENDFNNLCILGFKSVEAKAFRENALLIPCIFAKQVKTEEFVKQPELKEGIRQPGLYTINVQAQ